MSSLTFNTPQITILDNPVSIVEGLYSLNDLHRASGSNKKHQPSFFMRNQETKDLIAEIENEAGIPASEKSSVIKTIRGGDTKKQGTYVCKELVYRYAMWISPKFALLVIRAFDNLVTTDSNINPPQSPSTVKDRNGLVKAAHITQYKLGIGYDDVFSLIHHRFNIDKLGDLTVSQVGEATEYIQRMRYPQLAEMTHDSKPVPKIEPTYHYRNNERLVSQADAQGHLWTRPLADHEFIASTRSLPQFINDCDDFDLQELTALSYSVSKKMVEKQAWSNVVMVGNNGEQL